MTAGLVTPAVQEWAERGQPGARVTGCTVRPLDGGAVSRHVGQVTLHLAGSCAPLELVRKRLTGPPLPAAELELGYRWAALQIPVQHLPWTIAHRSARDTEAALDRIERALGDLPS